MEFIINKKSFLWCFFSIILSELRCLVSSQYYWTNIHKDDLAISITIPLIDTSYFISLYISCRGCRESDFHFHLHFHFFFSSKDKQKSHQASNQAIHIHGSSGWFEAHPSAFICCYFIFGSCTFRSSHHHRCQILRSVPYIFFFFHCYWVPSYQSLGLLKYLILIS